MQKYIGVDYLTPFSCKLTTIICEAFIARLTKALVEERFTVKKKGHDWPFAVVIARSTNNSLLACESLPFRAGIPRDRNYPA